MRLLTPRIFLMLPKPRVFFRIRGVEDSSSIFEEEVEAVLEAVDLSLSSWGVIFWVFMIR